MRQSRTIESSATSRRAFLGMTAGLVGGSALLLAGCDSLGKKPLEQPSPRVKEYEMTNADRAYVQAGLLRKMLISKEGQASGVVVQLLDGYVISDHLPLDVKGQYNVYSPIVLMEQNSPKGLAGEIELDDAQLGFQMPAKTTKDYSVLNFEFDPNRDTYIPYASKYGGPYANTDRYAIKLEASEINGQLMQRALIMPTVPAPIVGTEQHDINVLNAVPGEVLRAN